MKDERFPRTLGGLERSGYERLGDGKCRDCGAEITWFSTPNGKKVPLDSATLEAHWEDCKK